MTESAFKPSNKRYYQVITYPTHTQLQQQIQQTQTVYHQIPTISSTPVMRMKIAQSPAPKSFSASPEKTTRNKKKWSNQLKKIAVAKAKEIGLTKATRYLQLHYPNEYSELSPSTLQYWIHKCTTA